MSVWDEIKTMLRVKSNLSRSGDKNKEKIKDRKNKNW